jgi:hypothetical protein
MRSWLSLFFLAPALLAQVQETPFAPENIQRIQKQTLLIQASPGQQQYFQSTQEPPAGQRWLWQYQALPSQAPAGDPNYWHLQTPQAPERFPVKPPAKRRKLFFFAGNPTPKPLVIPKTIRMNGTSKVCSIPLIDALKGKPGTPDKMAIPAPPGNYSRDVIPPPAPPCDDGKR